MYCDRCGLNFLPKQSVCTRCKRVPTRYWFQFMSLVTIFAAVLCNSLLGVFLLPRLATASHGKTLFRTWWWFDQKAAMYGWVPLAIGLLAWDYFIWKDARPKVKGWFTRKLLTFSLAAGVAPLLPWWIPAGQPPSQFFEMIGRHQGVPILLAWSVVLVVTILLCIDPESRDYLLGHGRTLSMVSTGVLLLVLTMTVVGWSLTYYRGKPRTRALALPAGHQGQGTCGISLPPVRASRLSLNSSRQCWFSCPNGQDTSRKQIHPKSLLVKNRRVSMELL